MSACSCSIGDLAFFRVFVCKLMPKDTLNGTMILSPRGCCQLQSLSVGAVRNICENEQWVVQKKLEFGRCDRWHPAKAQARHGKVSHPEAIGTAAGINS